MAAIGRLQSFEEILSRAKLALVGTQNSIMLINQIRNEVERRIEAGANVSSIETGIDTLYVSLAGLIAEVTANLAAISTDTAEAFWQIEWRPGKTIDGNGEIDFEYVTTDVDDGAGGAVIVAKAADGTDSGQTFFSSHLGAGDYIEILNAEDADNDGTYLVASSANAYTITLSSNLGASADNTNDSSMIIRKIFDNN